METSKTTIGSKSRRAGPRAAWSARPVFIISTFADMQAERDHLRDQVFPALEVRLRERRQHLEPIDLRWGVETAGLEDSQQRDLLVLSVCLGEIQRSRPFLIVLLGDRYGWVPPGERIEIALREQGSAIASAGQSVTALEVEYGVLTSEDMLRRCHVFLREPLPYRAMPPQIAARYSDEHGPGNASSATKLHRLKTRVRDDPTLAGRVHSYVAAWDDKRHRVTGLEEWGDNVIELLWRDLDEETREFAEQPPLSWQAEERWSLEQFVEDRLRDFVGRDDEIAKLTETATSVAKPGIWGVCVTGESGAGKSSLFACLHRRLSDRDDVVLLSHAAGISARSTSVDQMLRRWIEELCDAMKEPPPPAESLDSTRLQKSFGELLARSAAKHRVVLLVDALNQFERAPGDKVLTWLPTQMPSNARLVATTLPGLESESLSRRDGIEIRSLGALGENETQQIARAVCRRHHRELNLALLAVLASKRNRNGASAASLPLWLGLAVEELNLIGADEFERAETDPCYRELRAGDRLAAMLRDVAESLPADVDTLYDWMLARAERLFGTAWVRAVVSLIALGREGWRDSDLQAMLSRAAAIVVPGAVSVPWNDLRFAAVRRSFQSHLVQRGNAARWTFFHTQMRDSVVKRCLADPKVVRRMHELIVEVLDGLPQGDPVRANELVFHHLAAGETRNAAADCINSAIKSLNFHVGVQVFTERALASMTQDDFAGVRVILEPIVRPQSHDYFLVTGLCKIFHQNVLPTLKLRAPLRHSLFLCEATERAMIWAMGVGISKHFNGHLAASQREQGDLHVQLGDVDTAMTCYARAVETFDRLFQYTGKETDFLSLANCYERVGRAALQQGNLEGAHEAAAHALSMYQQIADMQPDDVIWAHDVARCGELVGDVEAAAGHWQRALDVYQIARVRRTKYLHHVQRTGRSIQVNLSANVSGFCPVPRGETEGLFETPPSQADREHSLAMCWVRIADATAELGRVKEAIANYRKSLQTLLRLLVDDPINDLLDFDRTIAAIRLARTLLKQSRSLQGSARETTLNEAVELTESAIKTREALTRRHSDYVLWRQELAQAHELVAAVFTARGDREAAAASLAESVRLREHTRDNSIARWQPSVEFNVVKVDDVRSPAIRERRKTRVVAYLLKLAIRLVLIGGLVWLLARVLR